MNSIVTVVGKDSVGIISAVSTAMTDNNINILDISQTILSDFFTMIMMVDLSKSKVQIKEFRSILEKIGKDKGVEITIQHEQVFQAMHRI